MQEARHLPKDLVAERPTTGSNSGSAASSRSRSAESVSTNHDAVLSRVGSQTVLRATRDVPPISPGRVAKPQQDTMPLPEANDAKPATAAPAHVTDAIHTGSAGSPVAAPPQLELGVVLSAEDGSRGESRPQSGLRYGDSTTPLSARRSSPRLLAPVTLLGNGGTPLAAGGTSSHHQHPLWSLPHAIMRQSSFHTPLAVSNSREASMDAEGLVPPPPQALLRAADVPSSSQPSQFTVDEDFGDFLGDTIRLPDAAEGHCHQTVSTDPIDAPFTEVTIALPPHDAQAVPIGGVVVGSPKRRSEINEAQRRDGRRPTDDERQEVQLRMAASASGQPFVATGLFCHMCGAQADTALELRLHWLLCQEKTDRLIDALVAHPLCSVLGYPTHPLRDRVMSGTLCLETELLGYNTRALAILEDATCWCRGCGTGHALHRMQQHLQDACPRHLKGMPDCPLGAPHHLTCTEQDVADAAAEHVLIGRLSEEQNHRIVLGQFDWRTARRSASPVCVRPKRVSQPRASATPRRSASPRAWRQ